MRYRTESGVDAMPIRLSKLIDGFHESPRDIKYSVARQVTFFVRDLFLLILCKMNQ